MNAVLYGASAAVICRPKIVLNAAARLVVGAGKYAHNTPVLRDVLHWLPVRQRSTLCPEKSNPLNNVR